MPANSTTPTVTPWRTQAEFSQLKSWFFPAQNDSSSSLASKQRAIARTKAYMIRGNVPHAVECTGMLVSAQIEDTPSANAISTRLAMSTALIRFVNGMIDPHQKGSYAIPMQVIARDIGLPVFLVDLRHTCTHETLPSLRELRAGVEEALKWLLENYWSKQADHVTQTLPQVDSEEVKEIFRQWRRLYRDNRDLEALSDLNTTETKIETRFAFLAKQLIKYYESDHVTLFATMVHQKVLISKNQICKSLLMPLLKSIPKEIISELFLYMFEEAQRVDSHVTEEDELSLVGNPLSEWLEVFIEEGMLVDAQATMLTCSKTLSKTTLNVLDAYLMLSNDAKLETIRQTMRDVVLSGDARLDTAMQVSDMVKQAAEFKLRVKQEDMKRAGGFVSVDGEEVEEGGPFKRVRVN